jgi:hypothetical protein
LASNKKTDPFIFEVEEGGPCIVDPANSYRYILVMKESVDRKVLDSTRGISLAVRKQRKYRKNNINCIVERL